MESQKDTKYSNEIEIGLNVPSLSVNQLWRVSYKTRHMYRSPKYVEWLKIVKARLKDQYGGPILEGSLCMKVEFYIHRKKDLDNLLKSLYDAMNEIIYLDDSQIFKITAKKIMVSSIEDEKINILIRF